MKTKIKGIKVKWTSLGLARTWYAIAMASTKEESKDKFMKMSWDALFDAAEAGEI